jgi:hypothetical protein
MHRSAAHLTSSEGTKSSDWLPLNAVLHELAAQGCRSLQWQAGGVASVQHTMTLGPEG